MTFQAPDMRHVNLPILFACDDFVVVEKPSGLLSIPGKIQVDCVIARVREIFPGATGSLMVHRLDMDTSGVMVVALRPEAQRALHAQFEARQVVKEYVGICAGKLQGEGSVRLATRVDLENRPVQIIDPVHGKIGETRWRALAPCGENTRVAFEPLTGRTHQIRVHAALGLGHPLLGDRLYGDPNLAPRLLLHAHRIAFADPASGKALQFEACVPF